MDVVTLVTLISIVAVACAPVPAVTTEGIDTASSAEPRANVDSAADDVIPVGPSALVDRFADAFPAPLIDPREVRPGGPPPDGIPPIDDPRFVTTAEADSWLNDVQPVLVVDINNDVRAYPIQIMMWHEIVNDTVGGVPIAITYCPLCNSAISFERRIRGIDTTFGTSGSLYNANLVMYDRTTESLWSQLDGRAVIGLLTGDTLKQVPSSTVSWGTFKDNVPDGKVLDRNNTGFERDYGSNPYTGLDDPNGQPFLFSGEVDVRAKAMQRIVAISDQDSAIAWTLDALRDESGIFVATTDFAGSPITIFWKSGEASALDTNFVATGRDVGTVAIFSPILDGEALTFDFDSGSFVDRQTASTWNILGNAISGPLKGSNLDAVSFVRTFWFSWAAFRPDTLLVTSRP